MRAEPGGSASTPEVFQQAPTDAMARLRAFARTLAGHAFRARPFTLAPAPAGGMGMREIDALASRRPI